MSQGGLRRVSINQTSKIWTKLQTALKASTTKSHSNLLSGQFLQHKKDITEEM